MTNLQDHFYQHSGRTGFSIPLLLAAGIPVSILMAVVYAYIVTYCPVVGYVNLLFLGGYVFITGLAAGYIAKIGKCRNAGVAFCLGCLLGLVGLYFSWVFFFKALAGMQGEDIPALLVGNATRAALGDDRRIEQGRLVGTERDFSVDPVSYRGRCVCRGRGPVYLRWHSSRGVLRVVWQLVRAERGETSSFD